MAIEVKDMASNWSGHTRPMFGGSEGWAESVENALAEVRQNRHGSALYDEVAQAARKVTIVRSLDGRPTNDTWVAGGSAGAYQSLATARGLGEALLSAASHGAQGVPWCKNMHPR